MLLLGLFCIAVVLAFALGKLAKRIERSFVQKRAGHSVAEIAESSGGRNPAAVSLALGAFDFLRGAAVVAAVAYGLVLVAVAIAGAVLRTGIPASWVLWIARWAHFAGENLDKYSLGWSVGAVAIASLALAIQAGRARQRAALGRFGEAQAQGINDLLRQKTQGTWEEIPASSSMEAITKAANDLIASREQILQQAARHGVGPEAADKKLSEQLDALKANYALHDVLRRLRLSWGPILNGEINEPQKRSPIASLVVSKGMASSLTATSRVLSVATLVLLFLSQVTLGFGPATNQIARFEDLAVGKAGETVEQELNAASQPQTTVARPTASNDSRTLEFLSRRLASKYQAETGFRLTPETREEAVRAAILAQDLPHDRSAITAREVVEKEVVAKHPGAWEWTKQNLSDYIASFQEPADKVEFQKVLWDNLVSVAISSASPKDHSFGADFTEEFAGDVTPDALRNGFSNFVKRVAASVASARSKEQVAAALDQTPSVDELPPTRAAALHSFASRVEAKKPYQVLLAMRRPDEPELVNIAHSAKTIDDLRPSVFVQSLDIMNSVSDYDDVYLSATRGHGMAYEAARETLKMPAVSDTIAKNVGYDFAATVAAPQTGGVVIGRPFSSGAKLDIRDITWQDSGGMVTLTLLDAAGRAKSVGPFRRDVVHQALSYVADGRIAAVTMLGTPFDLHHVAIHPSLEDSGLGCVVIASDTWIFDSMEDTPEFKEATKQWDAINNLYKLAWATRIAYLFSSPRDDKERQALNYAQNEQKMATDGAERALTIENPVSEKLSHISSNLNYYDRNLVEDIKTCAKRSTGDLTQFEGCIGSLTESALKQMTTTKDKTALRQMFASPPNFGIRSALMESAFQVDPDLNFLDLENGQPLWPFDTNIQAVAESAPEMLYDQDQKNYVEQNAWTFAGLQPLIEENLTTYMQNHPDSMEAFGVLKQFTIAQRLFRAGLSGSLGSLFPIEKLTELSRFTSGSVMPVSTPRWFVAASRPDESFMQISISSLDKLSAEPSTQLTPTQSATIRSCTAALKGSDAASVSQQCPAKSAVDSAELACKNSDCTFANLLRFAAFTAALRETADSARLYDSDVAWTKEKLSGCVANTLAKRN
jgi:hypothetical protein